jgi:serine/threonine protein kinase
VALHGEVPDYPAYAHLRPIEGGSHALVQIGWHVGFGINCAQKTFERPGREDAVAFAEPRMLYDLDHPNVVKILDTQPDPDTPHAITMVMPAHQGGNLYDAVTGTARFSVREVVEVVAQLADALNYLHGRGVLHRDVKPKNVLMGSRPTLCDFGIAARLDATGHTGPVRATFQYQAPEVAATGLMSPASDVYSLGLVAIEMLDGALLSEGLDAANVEARVDRGIRAYSDAVLSPSRRPPAAPDALRTILARCVRADQEARPTAAELVRLLENLKYVDWRHVEGTGLDGRWVGIWPAGVRVDRATDVLVTSRILTAGRSTGLRRLVAAYRRPGMLAERTIGADVSPMDVPAQDSAAVSTFFRTVSARVAQRAPVRRRA